MHPIHMPCLMRLVEWLGERWRVREGSLVTLGGSVTPPPSRITASGKMEGQGETERQGGERYQPLLEVSHTHSKRRKWRDRERCGEIK